MKWIISIDCYLGRLNPWNWWKECSWTLIRRKNSLNWQEIGTFEEKRAASGRRMKSSPILGHPPNSFLTRGRRFQSSPIGWVNRGVGNTAEKSGCVIESGCTDWKILAIEWLLQKSNLPLLSKHRDYATVCHLYKILHHLSSSLNPYNPHPRPLLRNLNSRASVPPFCRLTLCQKSFYPYAPTLWNYLPEDIIQCNSLQSFKSALRSHLG